MALVALTDNARIEVKIIQPLRFQIGNGVDPRSRPGNPPDYSGRSRRDGHSRVKPQPPILITCRHQTRKLDGT
jgi:hypothetical protein